MSDSVRTREAITKTREAVLAQQMHEVDKLTDKIVGAAERIERASAVIASAQGKSANPAPQTVHRDQQKRPAQPETSWPSRWVRLGVIVAISAGVGAGVARLMPVEYGEKASDLALASAVKNQIKLERGTDTLWRTMRPEVQNAANEAMGH
ncbi:hypothetical protein J4G52_24400 [Burkholderia cenocepacia]|uniref:hypothetical protein n=1 Tax=Burkholderia cenocepacia TaxID=95486 RepID=UPI001AA1AA57|nr:hypothetical protein [Burkholderia cenocepacia]MBO1856683.1 hypothetical protein [Burkholderia cenocepacia]